MSLTSQRVARDDVCSVLELFEIRWSHDERYLTSLRKALVAEVRALSGAQFEIFQHIDGLVWGEQWKQKLVSLSDEAVFLIPIITPSYFASEPCRQELKQFVDREDATGFKESILPIYYIETLQVQDDFHKRTDYLAQKVAEHNWGLWGHDTTVSPN